MRNKGSVMGFALFLLLEITNYVLRITFYFPASHANDMDRAVTEAAGNV